MKFLCDRCKTRYSIGDERVRGKILKIRCKNCANVITVREGMTDADASGAPRRNQPTQAIPVAEQVASAPAVSGGNGAAQPKSALGAAFASAMTKQPPPAALEEEWYVSIDGEQSGPFSLAEAQRWVGSKAFDADLHCWSEGFDDWLPVDKVSHFRGLRKKPAPPPTPAMPPPVPSRTGPARAITAAPSRSAQAAMATQQQVEEEPKPLFAATMASLEKSAPLAANGGAMRPAMPSPGLSGGLGAMPAPASGAMKIEARSNGTAPRTAIPVPQLPSPLPAAKPSPTGKGAGLRPVAAPKPMGFDGSENNATQIESPAFADEQPTAAAPPDMLRQLASKDDDATARPDDSANGEAFAAALATVRDADHKPAPVKQRSLSTLLDQFGDDPEPAAETKSATDTAPNDAFFDRMKADVAPMRPTPEPKGGADDLDIGEVSRVVNLADLAKSANKNKTGAVPKITGAVGKATGSVNKLTGAVPKLSGAGVSGKLNATAPVALIDAVETVPSGQIADVPLDAVAPLVASTHRRGMIALIIGALVLIGAAVVVVVFVVNNGNEVTSLGSDYDYNGQRADPTHKPGDPTPGSNDPSTNPFIPKPPVRPRPNPNPNPGSAKVTVDPPLGNSIKGDEVEAMARNSSGTTTACFRRADKGADAIRLADIKKINVTFHINPDGTVQGNNIVLSDNSSQVLTSCLQRMIGGWKFRPNAGGDFRFVFAKPE